MTLLKYCIIIYFNREENILFNNIIFLYMQKINIERKRVSQLSVEDCNQLLDQISILRKQVKTASDKILTQKIWEHFLEDNIWLYTNFYWELEQWDIKKVFSKKDSFKNRYHRSHNLPPDLQNQYNKHFKVSDNLSFEEIDTITDLLTQLRDVLIQKQEEQDRYTLTPENKQKLSEGLEMSFLHESIWKSRYIAKTLLPHLVQLEKTWITNELANNVTALAFNDQEIKDFLQDRNIFVFLNDLYTNNKVSNYIQILESITEIPEEFNDQTVNAFIDEVSQKSNQNIDENIDAIIQEIEKISPSFSQWININTELPLAKIKGLFDEYGITKWMNQFESLYQLQIVWKAITNEFQKVADISLHRKIWKTFIHRNSATKSHVFNLLNTDQKAFEQKILTQVLWTNYHYQNLKNFSLDELYQKLQNSIQYESPNDLLLQLGHDIQCVDFDFIAWSDAKEFYGREQNDWLSEGLYKKFPKIKYLMNIFQEEAIDSKFHFVETLSGKYKYVYLADYDKTLVISDDYGYATYIYDWEINIDLFAEQTLRELVSENKYTRIKFSTDKDPEIWKNKILEALKKENVQYNVEQSIKFRHQSAQIITQLYGQKLFDIRDFSFDTFKKFVHDWNTYIDTKKSWETYQWNLDSEFRAYIEISNSSLNDLYLHASMSAGGNNNPLTMSVLLYSLLESVDLKFINSDQINSLNGSSYYGELISLVLEYISTENIEHKNQKEAEIDKIFNLLISRNIWDVYIRQLLEKIYAYYPSDQLDELYSQFQTENDTCKEFKWLEFRNATCLKTIKWLIWHDCILSKKDVSFEELMELNSLRNQCMRFFTSQPLTSVQIDNIIYDFDSYHNGLFAQAFGDFDNFYIYLWWDIEHINNMEDEQIHNFIQKVYAAKTFINTAWLPDSFTQQVDFRNWSEKDLLDVINAPTNILKSHLPKEKISIKASLEKIKWDQQVYSLIRKLTWVWVVYKNGVLDDVALRTMIASYRIDYYRIQALHQYFSRLDWNFHSWEKNINLDISQNNNQDEVTVSQKLDQILSNQPENTIENSDENTQISFSQVEKKEVKKNTMSHLLKAINSTWDKKRKIRNITNILSAMQKDDSMKETFSKVVKVIDDYMYPVWWKTKILSQVFWRSIADDNIIFEAMIKNNLLWYETVTKASLNIISELLITKKCLWESLQNNTVETA